MAMVVVRLTGGLSGCGSGPGVVVWCVDGVGRRGSRGEVVAANGCQLSTYASRLSETAVGNVGGIGKRG